MDFSHLACAVCFTLRLRARTSQRQSLPARRMTESARRCAVPSVGSRGYALPSRSMRVRDGSLGDSFRRFLLSEKSTYLLLGKGETCSFLVRTRKERKEAANLRLDHLCGRQRFDGGYERRHPRSRGSRDPSIAAFFVNIMPEGAHTARALRLRARTFQTHRLPARGVVACASSASTATPSSRGYVLPSRKLRVRDGVSVNLLVLFSLRRKVHILSFGKERNMFFSLRKEKNEKKPQASGLTVGVSQKCIPSAPDTCLRTAGVRKPRRNTPNGQRVRSGSFAPAGADFPAALNSRTANVGLPSEARANNCREPWVYASQQKIESPRRESR